MASVTTAVSQVNNGPVLKLITKRIRNLRKKLNRITQLEESIAQGKSVNKEQENLLKSKPLIVAVVDELENFLQPLSLAVDEEINLAIQHKSKNEKKINGKKVKNETTPELKVTADLAAEAAELESSVIQHEQKQHEVEAEKTVETPVLMKQVETNAVGAEHKEQRGGGCNNGGGGGGRRKGRGGRSGGKGGPHQNGRNKK